MSSTTPSRASRVACFVYGLSVYALFLATFVYTIGFIANIIVPKSIDSGATGSRWTSIAVNALLLGLFAIQHAIMARPWFKARWTRIIPPAVERSTFVLATCIVLIIMFWQWRPMPTNVWHITNEPLVAALRAMSAGGWALVLYATFCIDHFDLFGLRQVTLNLRGMAYLHPGFATPKLYQMVRNPLMLGFLIAFWSTPVMSLGHLQFALMVTGYIFVGVNLEERDLLKSLGASYAKYRAETPMLIPGLKLRRNATDAHVAVQPQSI
ncbi:MAG: hypothetical protein KDA54_19490 [Phycisphaerales bacterium]|nr:hypothetical protein [Phycisphaerales bacterium]